MLNPTEIESSYFENHDTQGLSEGYSIPSFGPTSTGNEIKIGNHKNASEMAKETIIFARKKKEIPVDCFWWYGRW